MIWGICKKKTYELNLIIVASVIKTFSYFFVKFTSEMISIDIPHLHHISFPYSQKSLHTQQITFLVMILFWLIECHQSTVQQSTSTWLIYEKFSWSSSSTRNSLSRGIWLILMIINEWWVEGWEARIQTITAACIAIFVFLLILQSVLEEFF